LPLTLPLVIVTHGASLAAVHVPHAVVALTVRVTVPPLPETAGCCPFIENVHAPDDTGTNGGATLRTSALFSSLTNNEPSPATAIPPGLLKVAVNASSLSDDPDAPLPATVVMTPFAIFRIRLFPPSAMYRTPAPSTPTPVFQPSCADVAGPPSPA